jgi:aminoglycoside phosphotransferase (APT) family kinase protein
MLPQPGLKWVLNKCFDAEPTWTHDPKVETMIKLARKHLGFSDDDICTADYYMQGAFNKIYLVRCPRGGANEKSFVFRVSLPVDPGFKVSSDVATMNFMRDHTKAPVPRVLAFDPSHDNELGFAWTIMEMMPGRPLCEQWRYMTWTQKVALAKSIAEIVAQMFRHKFRGIGNLYRTEKCPKNQKMDRKSTRTSHHVSTGMTESFAAMNVIIPSPSLKKWLTAEYCVGRIVSMCFLWHNRVHYDVYRGPFASSFDWLAARLALIITDSEAIVNEPGGPQQRKASASKYASMAKRLQEQLPNFFPEISFYTSEGGLEVTTLHHYDTSGYNVLVDEEGRLTALLDWDGVSTVPLWKACQMPEFLMSRYIDEMEHDDKQGQVNGEGVEDKISKEESISREKEQLRTTFLMEMERIEPHWVEVYMTSVRLADFEVAVQLCDSVFVSDLVDEWLQNIEQGKEYWGLQQRLLAG